MKRNKFVAAATASVLAISLGACSSGGEAPSSGSDTSEPTNGASTSAEELTVWVMGDSSAHFDTLVAPFTEETGTTVKTVAIPWDSVDQKFTTAVASGDGPDLLQIGLSKLRNYADSGALLNLDAETIAPYPNLDPANFLEGIAGDATAVGGDVVSSPWVSDTRILFYRSDILADAGIDTPPSTWEELRADAKLLSERGDGKYGFYIPQWDSGLPVIMTWDEDGSIVDDQGEIDFDTPQFAKAVDLYTGMYADGSVPMDSDFDQTQGFVSGVTPLLVSGPYLASAITDAAPDLEGSWGVTTIPAAVTDTSQLAGSNLAVWGNTKNQDSALQLLDFLSRPETQVAWYELDGQLPTVRAALEDPKLTADPMVAVYSEQLANSRLLPLVPNWDQETGKYLLDALNSIVLTGANRDQALQGLFDATTGTPAN